MGLSSLLLANNCSSHPYQATQEMADHKVDDGLKKEIEAGKTLKDTPVPETGVNTHDDTLAGIAHFNKDKLSNVKTEEKVVLPSAEDIAAEKAGNRYAGFEACQQHQRGKC